MSTLTPEILHVQRLAALELANITRSRRADLKRDIKARRRSLAWLLDDPPAFIETMVVLELVLAAPAVGRVKALRLLRVCGVSPTLTVGALNGRRRGELVAALARAGR